MKPMITSLFGALLTTLAQAVIFSRAEVKTLLD